MDDFVVIDFETANPKRVSACSLGYVVIRSGSVTEKGEVLINPIGGHAEFQTKIHGIKNVPLGALGAYSWPEFAWMS